jgi:hypothetical protein
VFTSYGALFRASSALPVGYQNQALSRLAAVSKGAMPTARDIAYRTKRVLRMTRPTAMTRLHARRTASHCGPLVGAPARDYRRNGGDLPRVSRRAVVCPRRAGVLNSSTQRTTG